MKHDETVDDRDVGRARDVLLEALEDSAPEGARVVTCSSEHSWSPDRLRRMLRTRFTILAPGPDLVHYFDLEGGYAGWRDDGRIGSEHPFVFEPEAMRQSLVHEHGLDATTRLRGLDPQVLPPLGYTLFGVLSPPRRPAAGDVLRVWLDSGMRTIQALRGEPDASTRLASPADVAVARSSELMHARLERSGIEGEDAWYFALEPRAEQSSETVRQVRVATWRHWSEAHVELDLDRGDVVGWSVDRLAEPASPPPSEPEPVDLDALLAEDPVAVPESAQVQSVERLEYAEGHDLCAVRWKREEEGLEVDGDHIVAYLHPDSGRVVELQRKWRALDVSGARVVLTEDQAIVVANRERREGGVDDTMEVTGAVLKIVEHQPDPMIPGHPVDRVAWVVSYGSGLGIADLFIDATDGKLLRARGSG